MAKTKTKPFDAAKYLKDKEAQAAYLNEALASKDAAEISRALGTKLGRRKPHRQRWDVSGDGAGLRPE